MEATNTIYEIMTLLASATKGLKKSIDLDGIDIFIAQSMTDIVRKVRDLAPEEMDILLSQLKCELDDENYVRVCGELSGTMSEYLDLYESHKAAIDEGYSPFHLCEIAKAVECHDHDIFNKLEGDAPLALSKIVTRIIAPIKRVQVLSEIAQDIALGKSEKQKNMDSSNKVKFDTFRSIFINDEGYGKVCALLLRNGCLNICKCKTLYVAATTEKCRIINSDFKNMKDFVALLRAEFPESLSFQKDHSIYYGDTDDDLLKNLREEFENTTT